MKNKERQINFFKALAVFSGTIIGVGIFGLPYVAMKAGFLPVVIYFILIAFLAIVVHYLLGEVARDTHKIARIPGYAEEYLGKKWKKISFVVTSLGLTGALLAYLILGGEFLRLFIGQYWGGSATIYTLIFFATGAVFIYYGIKSIAQFELIMLGVFIVILLLFFFHGASFINLENFLTFNPKYLTLPYGVVLFSLWGITMIPEVKEMVDRDREQLRKVIAWGIIIAAFCYLFFIFTIYGASGANTSQDAISGFAKSIGNRVVTLGYIFGLITTFTSYLTLGLTLKKIFWYDLKMPERISWAIACFGPLALFFLGLRNFIDVIGLTGAIILGIEAIIVVYIYKNFIEKRFQRRAEWYINFLPILFVVGIILHLIYYFKDLV